MFQKATRRKAKLKLTITGPSGSGKTWSALLLAKGIGGKIAVIDTENDSASLYADQPGAPPFDSCNLRPPYTTAKYLQALNAACAAGYEIVIVDSGSHQWAGEGGILNRKEQMDQKPGSNSYTNWGKLTPEQEQFKSAILHAPVHLIMTLRSKQEYALSKDEKTGKSKVEKLGMAPIQRDGMEYEFTTVFDVDMTHNATVSKDRTGLFDGKYFTLTEETGKELAAWLNSGQEALAPTPTAGNPHQVGPGTPASGVNPPRSTQAPGTPNKNDPDRLITTQEFNGLKVTAGQHLWNADQFFAVMRGKYGTVIGTALKLRDLVEFKQVIVSMSGAQAAASVSAATSQATQLRGPVESPRTHVSSSPPPEPEPSEPTQEAPPPQEFAPPMDEPHPSDAELGLALPTPDRDAEPGAFQLFADGGRP